MARATTALLDDSAPFDLENESHDSLDTSNSDFDLDVVVLSNNTKSNLVQHQSKTSSQRIFSGGHSQSSHRLVI